MGHEDLSRTHIVKRSSDRNLGLVFAAVFTVIAGWPMLSGASPRWWALTVAVAFALIAAARPTLLSGLNRQWSKLGVVLARLVSPIALAILFYGFVTPLGVVMRLTGKDPLRLRRDAVAPSYWIPRQPPGPPPDSMGNQF